MAELASLRIAYGQALADYGAVDPNVVVLDADVSASTQSHYFAARYPSRFFNVGIAEAGMVDVAAGLALGGKVPFVNTFAFLPVLCGFRKRPFGSTRPSSNSVAMTARTTCRGSAEAVKQVARMLLDRSLTSVAARKLQCAASSR